LLATQAPGDAMDMILGGLAFAAIIVGQFAAVIAVHGRRERRAAVHGEGASSDVAAPPHADHRATLIWHGGLT